MIKHSAEVVLVLRGFLCKSDYPSLQYVGQYGTDDQVVDMVTRVHMSAQSIFDQKPPMDREINC
ncbi:MAG: hypothetical protein ACP5VS_04410 [Desulfomonilaceae bacterium]